MNSRIVNHLLIADRIIVEFDSLLSNPEWPYEHEIDLASLSSLLHNLHFFNSSLWREEDLARRTKVSDSEIAKNKRNIDRFNQSRNDHIEKIDELILEGFSMSPELRATACRSSETAGSMADRISILSLKIHHMDLQCKRTDVGDQHRSNSIKRSQTLREQRIDLLESLSSLLRGMSAGTHFFKTYKQFKMYNDPALNPVLVAERTGSSP